VHSTQANSHHRKIMLSLRLYRRSWMVKLLLEPSLRFFHRYDLSNEPLSCCFTHRNAVRLEEHVPGRLYGATANVRRFDGRQSSSKLTTSSSFIWLKTFALEQTYHPPSTCSCSGFYHMRHKLSMSSALFMWTPLHGLSMYHSQRMHTCDNMCDLDQPWPCI
jgi:hypothetical protein